MLSKRILKLALFCLVWCQLDSVPANAAARPQGAGTGEAVAHVHVVDGDATVKAANGLTFRAAPGVPLLRYDEITAPGGGFVVLRLRNNYLVRIDEELSLTVTDIVLLDAPQATEGLEKQLNRLLTKKERQKGERIAGWHARLTGAQTVPPEPVAKGLNVYLWQTRVGDKLEGQIKPLPALAQKMLQDKDLMQCVRLAVSKLPVSIQHVSLMIKLQGHQVQRVALGGGVPTPLCAGKGYLGKKMPEGPEHGWVIFEVSLS
jgi:hypothetical protein